MAQTLSSILPGDAEEVYNSSDWADKRAEYDELWTLYNGDKWAELTGHADPDVGGGVLRYPLQLNPIAKVCRIHRAVMFGMRDDTPSLPVKATGETRPFQDFVNAVWQYSDGIAMMEEAGLLMQIYGGHYFQVAWEFWNKRLPWRIAVRSLKSPGWVLPIYDIYNPWELLEAWIGYYIPAEVARTKYNVTLPEDDERALYMEHWTHEAWRITVAGRVPRMEVNGGAQPLEGENPWGIVPLVYIPHEREGKFYGRSLVKGLLGLAKELNARQADLGDAVREQTHRQLVGKNMRTRGPVKARKLANAAGRAIGEFFDIGDRPPLTNAGDPDLDAIPNPGIPPSIAEFPDQLWGEIRRQADIAAVAMGDDDVSGGRITGPVTAYRMWPTISHTMTERSNFSTGLNHVARILAIIAEERERSNVYASLGVEPPGITREMQAVLLKQSWYPMIPIERLQKIEMLNARLQAGGVSLYTYLTELGEDNVEEEMARIWEDERMRARIEASVKATTGGNNGTK